MSLEEALAGWLPQQRWYAGKGQAVTRVEVEQTIALPSNGDVRHLVVGVDTDDGARNRYQLLLGWCHDDVPARLDHAVIGPDGRGVVYDAVHDVDATAALFRLLSGAQAHDALSFHARVSLDPTLGSRVIGGEQSNTSLVFGETFILKLFRRLQPGENPDVEIGRFLTEVAHFPRIAPFLGELTLTSPTGSHTTSAMLQGLVKNEADGWQWTLDELTRFYESVSTCSLPQSEGEAPAFATEATVPLDSREHAGLYLEAAALLGRRTAEMHLALATETDDPSFAAETFTEADLAADAQRIDIQINLTLDALKQRMSTLKDELSDDAATLLTRRLELFRRAHIITGATPSGQRIRIHGDFHLGQILRAKNDFIFLDFEGEPARSLEERRRKQSPLKDVAGMLRSFSYAAWSALDTYLQRYPDRIKALEPWARLWQNAVSAEFLKAYRHTASARPGLLPEPDQAQALLNAYLLEKALYELLYELNNRPAWVRIPLAGILALPNSAA